MIGLAARLARAGVLLVLIVLASVLTVVAGSAFARSTGSKITVARTPLAVAAADRCVSTITQRTSTTLRVVSVRSVGAWAGGCGSGVLLARPEKGLSERVFAGRVVAAEAGTEVSAGWRGRAIDGG